MFKQCCSAADARWPKDVLSESLPPGLPERDESNHRPGPLLSRSNSCCDRSRLFSELDSHGWNSGHDLAYVGDLATWRSALEGYGELQVACIGNNLRELEGIVPSRESYALAAVSESSWDALLDFVGARNDLPIQDIRLLREIGPPLVREFTNVPNFGIPSSIDHGDFHPFNVIASSRGCVFLDWSEASIAHPFFSAAAFLSYAVWLRPDIQSQKRSLTSAYLARWSKYAPQQRLFELWMLIELIAPVYFALSLWQVICASPTAPEWECDEWYSGMKACLKVSLQQQNREITRMH